MDPIPQMIMEQFSKMSAKLKTDICTSQETMKHNTSSSQEKIKNDMQDQIKSDVCVFQNQISTDISAFRSGQAEFEKNMLEKLDHQVRDNVTVVKQQIQGL
jgi:hypothetical protein